MRRGLLKTRFGAGRTADGITITLIDKGASLRVRISREYAKSAGIRPGQFADVMFDDEPDLVMEFKHAPDKGHGKGDVCWQPNTKRNDSSWQPCYCRIRLLRIDDDLRSLFLEFCPLIDVEGTVTSEGVLILNLSRIMIHEPV